MKLTEILKLFFRFFSANRKVFLFLLFYLTFSTYFLRGHFSLDPDFGWRYKVGEIITHKGIPRSDPFTYTMPSFPFVDHAWMFSLLTYLTYRIFQNSLLSLFLVFLVFFSISISNMRVEKSNTENSGFNEMFEKWINPLTISAVSFLFLFFSVRAQIVSWFLFAVLNTILFGKDLYVRYKYFLPLLFLLWANLHGGYALGLMEFLYFVVFRIFISKKGHSREAFIFIISIVLTLVTPYGISGWREVSSSIFDSRLRWSIAEWMPSVTFFDISMAFFIALSLTMIYFRRKSIPKIQKFLFYGLLLFGLSSRRNLPYFFIYALPLAINSISNFYNEIRKDRVAEERFNIFFSALRIFAIAALLFQLYSNFWRGIIVSSSGDKMAGFYPKKAVLYLKGREIEGEIFSNYGWGGFLIWQLPGKKVFIDGRMPSWKNTKARDPRETLSAYDDYLNILKGETDFNSLSDKYNIEYVLWVVDRPGFFKDIEEKVRSMGILGQKKERFVFAKYLEENGWVIVYQDDNALIFKRFSSEKL